VNQQAPEDALTQDAYDEQALASMVQQGQWAAELIIRHYGPAIVQWSCRLAAGTSWSASELEAECRRAAREAIVSWRPKRVSLLRHLRGFCLHWLRRVTRTEGHAEIEF
jgi:hypothetical protein